VSYLFRWIKNRFYFSRIQRIASAGLLLLLMSGTLFLLIQDQLFRPSLTFDQDFEQEVRRFETLNRKYDTLTPFVFDPNTTTLEQWLQMGFDEKKASSILKYIRSGGKFGTKEDFHRLRIITDKEFAQLEPFIKISKKKPAKVHAGVKTVKPEPFPFDPNHIEETDWQKLGLKAYQYQNIVSYVRAGGVFRTKRDLLKLYSISDDDYHKLARYILLPEKDTAKKWKKHKPKPHEKVLVELNSADSADLTMLYGIGPSFAKRIIRYRNMLGGYCNKSQLLEVYGMDSSRYNGFAEQVRINTGLVQKIDLNNSDFKTILKHPYVEYYIVKSIFKYKEANGRFDSVAELKNVPLIYDELYEKLKPYFTVTNTGK